MSLPIYLYTGPEFGERNDAIDAIKSALKKKYGSTEEHLYYSMETPLEKAISVLSSDSLFVPATVVVYKGAETIKKKEEISALSTWLESTKSKEDGDNSVLVLVSDETNMDSKLEKLIPKENRRIFWEMFENRKVPWIKEFFKKNGYSIEENACEELLALVENNTEALRTECSRFFTCFEKGAKITTENVESIVAHNRSETAFTLFNTIADTSVNDWIRLKNALEILQKIRLSKESSAVSLIAGLSYCFRKLILWQELCKNGIPDDWTLKTKGFSKLAKNQYIGASKLYTPIQAQAITALLSSTDIDIRSGGQAVEDILLQTLLYSIIIKKGASIDSYNSDWE